MNKINRKQPNILLIMSDQHRADHLGRVMGALCRTPNLDALAESGVWFRSCVTPCPLCTPARSAVFSGLYPHQSRGWFDPEYEGPLESPSGDTNMMVNDTSLREKPLLTQALRQAGYYSAYAGKWHLGQDVLKDWFDEHWDHYRYSEWCAGQGLPDGKGWKDNEVRSERKPQMSTPRPKPNPIAAEYYEDAYIADRAIRYIQECPAEQPFFITCGFEGPHPPFKIPEPYFSMYEPNDFAVPPDFGQQSGEPPSNKRNYYRKLFEDHGTAWEDWKHAAAVYSGFVTLIDDQVGRLVETLKREGLYENTVVIYISDHGEMLGRHGLWHKMTGYEDALRVPFIVGGGAVRPNPAVSGAMVSLLDMAPTLLGLAGLPVPAVYEGENLAPVIRGQKKNTDRRYLFSGHQAFGEWHGAVDWRLVTDNQFKYIWNCGDADELYDLIHDPHERMNLIPNPEYGEVANRLRLALKAWIQKTGDPLYECFS